MRVIIIAMLVFFLNLSVQIVDVLNIYQFNIPTQGGWNDEVSNIENRQYLRSDVTADVSTSFGFGDFIVGMNIFIDFIYRVLFISATLKLFGTPATIANLVSLPVFLLYGLGLAQFIANRGTKGMQ
ncbi:MAG: hypothetical protein IH934_04675 [Nanoarchaeota archaeon]|nr:hypothetical protein [Nanoarchaeota archaeon]